MFHVLVGRLHISRPDKPYVLFPEQVCKICSTAENIPIAKYDMIGSHYTEK